MLKELMKKVFNPAQADQEKEVPEMTTQEQQPTAANEQLAEMAAALATATETQATMQEQMAELQSKYDLATEALAQSAEAQATLVANAKAAVLASRTASLSAVMGDVKAPLLAASLESLDDATFATVLSGYAASFEAEEKSDMFVEKGVAAEATPVAEVEESAEMKIIKAKQAAARLQTN
jgi:hypothetical protein